jgi:5,10-methylenetetrahydrofolate reductase
MSIEFNLITEEHLNPVKEEAVAIIDAGKAVLEHAVGLIKDAAQAAVAGVENVVGIGGDKPDLAAEAAEEKLSIEALNGDDAASLAQLSGSGGIAGSAPAAADDPSVAAPDAQA